MNNLIMSPQYKDISSLKQIWKEAFSDNDEFINSFFENCFSTTSCLAYYVNNRPVSMLFMLECDVFYNGIINKAMYIYAVATLKQFRSNGFMRSLEQNASTIATDKNKDLMILIPQSSELFKMYSKLGYTTAFFNAYKSYKRPKLDGLSPLYDVKKLSELDFFSKRTCFLNDLNFYASLDKKYNDFICKSNAMYDINAYSVNDEYVLGFKNNNQFEVIESSIKYENIDKILPSLFLKFDVEKISFKNIINKNTDLKPYGMAKLLNNAVKLNTFTDSKPPCYMNLMLD
ncbi:MAG: GNAT family N-acetyltransferase [Oscillospiraceae bacterium]